MNNRKVLTIMMISSLLKVPRNQNWNIPKIIFMKYVSSPRSRQCKLIFNDRLKILLNETEFNINYIWKCKHVKLTMWMNMKQKSRQKKPQREIITETFRMITELERHILFLLSTWQEVTANQIFTLAPTSKQTFR